MLIEDPDSDSPKFRKLRRASDMSGHAHELTVSCFQRFQFLSKDRTREWFVEALSNARCELEFDLWAYVIMPEHVHVLVYPRGNDTLAGRIRGAIKEPVARKAIKYLEERAPEWIPKISVQEGQRVRRRFWQAGGGYDRNGIKIETVHAMIDYIHNNPVRRGLVAKTTDWEWSSARWYAGISPVRIEMDATLPTRID